MVRFVEPICVLYGERARLLRLQRILFSCGSLLKILGT